MKLFKRFTGLMLAVCLMASSFGLVYARAAEKDYFPEVTNDDIPYEEMSHELVDVDSAVTIAEEIETMLAETEPDAGKIAEAFNEIYVIYRDCIYVNSVIYNDTIINPLDEVANAKSVQNNIDLYELDTILVELGNEIFESKVGEAVKKSLDADLVKYIIETPPLTEEEKDILNEIQLFIVDYNNKCNYKFTKNIDGVEYDTDGLYSLYMMGAITLDEYYLYTGELTSQYNEYMSDTYFGLVDARTRLAKEYGYDNFYDYAAEKVFTRGTTPKQIKTFSDAVKKYLVPIYTEVSYIYSYEPSPLAEDELYYSTEYELSELTSTVGEYIEDLSPEMYEAYDYMMDLNLFDLYNPGNRVPTTYQITIGKNKPFVMNGYSNGYGDLSTSLFHEFGHANETYYFTDNVFSTIDYDLAEVHSTSLEMLSLPYYEEMFGTESTRAIETGKIYSSLYYVIIGCVIDELEQFVFIEGADNMKEISAYYTDLLHEYGMVPDTDTREYINGWTQISHVFLSPCYYISYALSNAAALEIYTLSKQDYDKAVDTYLSICGLGTDNQFNDTITEGGLATPLKAKNIKALAEDITETMNIEDRIMAIYEMYAEPEEDYSDFKIYKIKAGDTLGKIAREHKVDIEEIIEINGIENPKRIYAGDILILPSYAVMKKVTYTIQPGDTLYEIAKAFDASMESIAMQNNIEDMTLIYAGKTLEFEY